MGVKVFLSFKHEDIDEAERLGKILEKRSGQLSVFISSKILAGDDWSARIRKELRESELLLLLFTQPSHEWDWPLFEAGLFTPLRDDPDRRVVCLHPADGATPRPLENLQSIPVHTPADPESENARDVARQANRTRLRDAFLVPLFRTGVLTGGVKLNPNLDDGDLDELGLEIASLFAPAKVEQVPYARRLILTFPPGVESLPESIPDDVMVRAEGGDLRPFGRVGDACSWSELMDCFEDGGDSRWITELARSIHRASTRKTLVPGIGTFRGNHDGRIYRPVLYRVDRTGDRDQSFVVLLSEQATPDHLGGPDRAGDMFKLILIATRFRWELIEEFLERLEALAPEDSTDNYVRLRHSLEAILEQADAMEPLLAGPLPAGRRGLSPGPAHAVARRTGAAWTAARRCPPC